MRILLLTTHLEIGGIPVYVITLARALKWRGHFPMVASSGGWFEAQLAQEGIPHHRIRCGTSNELHPRVWLEVFPKLLGILHREKIQVIHANTRVTQLLGSALSALTGVPMVTTCHGFHGEKLGRRLFPCWGTKVIAISRPTLDELVRQDRLISPDQATLVRNGIEVSRFLQPADPKEVDRFRQAWGLKGRPVIGTIARLNAMKGQEFLVRAVPGLLKEFPDLALLLVGEGPEREKLVRLAYELKIQDHLIIAPSVEETRIPLAAMDLFVYPSLQEGFGLAIVEAMAAGVPVVATQSGGPSDIIEPGVSGLLVPPGDTEALGAAVRSLLADPARRQQIAQAARDRAKLFDIERVALETEQVYACVITGGAPVSKAMESPSGHGSPQVSNLSGGESEGSILAQPAPLGPASGLRIPPFEWASSDCGSTRGR